MICPNCRSIDVIVDENGVFLCLKCGKTFYRTLESVRQEDETERQPENAEEILIY